MLSVEDGYRSVHGFSKIFPRVVSLPITEIMGIYGARPSFQSLIAVKTTECTLHVKSSLITDSDCFLINHFSVALKIFIHDLQLFFRAVF